MEYRNNSWCEAPRSGIRDLWNAELCQGAEWSKLDYPKVRTTALRPPTRAISWHKAITLHNKMIAAGESNYQIKATIHCYSDDPTFDGGRQGIWSNWKRFYDIASHFEGVMGVDFSINTDFPDPVKRNQIYKMRAIEYGAISRGIETTPNARWGTRETWDYCFDAPPEEEPLSVGVVGSGLKKIENRPVFDAGLRELVRRKRPPALVVVGSAEYPVFHEIEATGIRIYQLDGDTSSYFKEKGARHV